jgi:hypothetical protein
MRLIIMVVNFFRGQIWNTMLAQYTVDLSRMYVNVTQKYFT